MYKEKIVQFSNGVKVLCCTPHDCTFADGDKMVSVPKCGALLAAKAENQEVGQVGPAKLVAPIFKPTPAGLDELSIIRAELGDDFGNVAIVGSMVSAQAYPGFVVSLVPAPGYERVPPDQKRMSIETFSTFKK